MKPTEPFIGVHLPMMPETRALYESEEGGPYRFACPTCAAPAFHWCTCKTGLRRCKEHVSRAALANPPSEQEPEEPCGRGYHLIDPEICQDVCYRCGAPCQLYARHNSQRHICSECFPSTVNTGGTASS
jgi:hypothetical protein